jgi:chain length determinant protein EpsF
MALGQILRVLWARKWLILALFVLVSAAGIAFVVTQQKQYVAETSLLVEMRPDPALGMVTPALAAPGYMATQVEVIRSERVAARAVKILGVERSAGAVAQWREATQAKIPLERYFADVLKGSMLVEPLSSSNIIEVRFASPDPIFAQAAANAFAQAYLDVSVELRIAPARQSAGFLEDQVKTLRTNLEDAQQKLSTFQQTKGIVVSDERLDQENARYNALLTQLAMAQSERVELAARQRNSGSETSPDVLSSGAVSGLKAQLATAETRLTEISSIVGRNHPQRQQLEAQIGELRQQLAAETRRVAGGAATSSRSSGQKIGELQAMVDAQKKQLLSLRGDRDAISVLVRDVETAQRAYDAVTQRIGQLNLEGQNNLANTRLLSPAIEPLVPTKPKIPQGVIVSLLAGLAVALGVAFALELFDRRIRGVDDMAGVPILGILRPPGSKQPVYRRLIATTVPFQQPPNTGPGLLGMSGSRP